MIFWIIFGSYILAVFLNFIFSTPTPIPEEINKAPIHKLHKWIIDENGKYWCEECGLVAGTVTTENGDY